ncbi:hypothetical protein ONZ45_g8938 [Pleurotus djamor]|nr:hypothetical protein ONZ45_g8938 [Pleurotus djamor]
MTSSASESFDPTTIQRVEAPSSIRITRSLETDHPRDTSLNTPSHSSRRDIVGIAGVASVVAALIVIFVFYRVVKLKWKRARTSALDITDGGYSDVPPSDTPESEPQRTLFPLPRREKAGPPIVESSRVSTPWSTMAQASSTQVPATSNDSPRVNASRKYLIAHSKKRIVSTTSSLPSYQTSE